jgi:hypothetical protein
VNWILLGSLGNANVYQLIITAAEDRQTALLIPKQQLCWPSHNSCTNSWTVVVLFLQQLIPKQQLCWSSNNSCFDLQSSYPQTVVLTLKQLIPKQQLCWSSNYKSPNNSCVQTSYMVFLIILWQYPLEGAATPCKCLTVADSTHHTVAVPTWRCCCHTM